MVKRANSVKNQKRKSFVLVLVIAIITISLVIGSFYSGYVIGNAAKDSEMPATKHMHSKYEVQPNEVAPSIDSIDVTKDAKMGWNLTFKTNNFRFTPENVNTDHAPGEGHAHLYINDEKITRLYSDDYYIKGYEEGVHKVTVTLNTNKHADYYVNGQQVKAETKIVGSHGHEDGTKEDHSH